MRPFIIGVGGAQSGCGKTFVAENLLKKLEGFGALKCTKTAIYTSVIDDPRILRIKNKDTARLIQAGASEVLWVQSTPHELGSALDTAIQRLSHLEGVVLEGNGAIELLKPDIVIFIFGDGSGRMKKGSERVLDMADVVITDVRAPLEGLAVLRKERAVFGRAEAAAYVAYVERAVDERRTRKSG